MMGEVEVNEMVEVGETMDWLVTAVEMLEWLESEVPEQRVHAARFFANALTLCKTAHSPPPFHLLHRLLRGICDSLENANFVWGAKGCCQTLHDLFMEILFHLSHWGPAGAAILDKEGLLDVALDRALTLDAPSHYLLGCLSNLSHLHQAGVLRLMGYVAFFDVLCQALCHYSQSQEAAWALSAILACCKLDLNENGLVILRRLFNRCKPCSLLDAIQHFLPSGQDSYGTKSMACYILDTYFNNPLPPMDPSASLSNPSPTPLQPLSTTHPRSTGFSHTHAR